MEVEGRHRSSERTRMMGDTWVSYGEAEAFNCFQSLNDVGWDRPKQCYMVLRYDF